MKAAGVKADRSDVQRGARPDQRFADDDRRGGPAGAMTPNECSKTPSSRAAMTLDALRAVERAFDPPDPSRATAMAARTAIAANLLQALRRQRDHGRTSTGKVQDGYSYSLHAAGSRPVVRHARARARNVVVNIEVNSCRRQTRSSSRDEGEYLRRRQLPRPGRSAMVTDFPVHRHGRGSGHFGAAHQPHAEPGHSRVCLTSWSKARGSTPA